MRLNDAPAFYMVECKAVTVPVINPSASCQLTPWHGVSVSLALVLQNTFGVSKSSQITKATGAHISGQNA
jgi:hypothetical protein